MSRRSRQLQSASDAGTAILGDEQAAELFNRLEALTQQVAALEDQVRSQYTSIATYAAISSEQVEFTRNEARADLDRTRDTIIGLLEQLRGEMGLGRGSGSSLPVPAPLPTPTAVATDHGPVLQRLDDVEHALVVCFERQRELASTVAAVFDTITAGTREPIADLALI